MKKKSFLMLERPVITCIIGEPDPASDIATIKNAEYEGAKAFAVHFDRLDRQYQTEEVLKKIADSTTRPAMMLLYRAAGERIMPYTDEERLDILKSAVKCGAACIDITADSFAPSPDEYTKEPSAVDRQLRYIDEIHEMGGEVVISSHVYHSMTCEQVVEHMLDVEKRGPDIAKIVTLANTQEEFLEAIRTTMELRKVMKIPFIHLCGGEFAKPLRLLEPLLGSFLTFCPLTYTQDFISIQPLYSNMVSAIWNLNWSIGDVKGID